VENLLEGAAINWLMIVARTTTVAKNNIDRTTADQQ